MSLSNDRPFRRISQNIAEQSPECSDYKRSLDKISPFQTHGSVIIWKKK